MLANPPTLSGRLTKTIALFSVLLFAIFTLVTVFLTYSLEDAMFSRQLIQAGNDLSQGKQIPTHFIAQADLSQYGQAVTLQENIHKLTLEQRFGEFSYNNIHYHFMLMENGALLLPVEKFAVVSRGLDKVLLILLVVFLPFLLLSLVIAKRLTNHALKPFNDLSQLFNNHQQNRQLTQQAIDKIEEQDVKLIANELQFALDEKARVLEEQIVFNQGLSHEIRTPLQVMKHSLELLSATVPEVTAKQSFHRLEKSTLRTQRISEALLWLTSNEEYKNNSEVQQCIEELLEQSADLLKAHQISVNLNINSPLMMPLPDTVLELIISNLITNAIQHAQTTESGKTLDISITADGVHFSNAMEENSNENSRGFGLGIQLVTQLANRFSLLLKIQQQDNHFVISLINP